MAAIGSIGRGKFLPEIDVLLLQLLQFTLLLPDRGQKGCVVGRNCGEFLRVFLNDRSPIRDGAKKVVHVSRNGLHHLFTGWFH